MVKINFQNLPNTTTPVSAENLNAIQNNAETAINAVETSASTNLTNATKGYQTTQTGESFTLTDSAGVKGKIDVVNGKTSQATRTGKNLLNIYDINQAGYTITKNDVTFTLLNNGGIKINGTATANASIPLIGTYQSGNTKISFNGNYVQSGLADNVVINYYSGTTLLGSFYNNTTQQISSNCDYAIIAVTNGITYDNVICYPQLEEGTTATDYEQYGKSPTPDYPSDIRNVGDNINILEMATGTLTNANGVDVTVTAEKIILNGTATANTWITFNPSLATGTPPGENRYIFEDAEYTFSTKLKGTYNVSSSSGVNFNINTSTTKMNPFNETRVYSLTKEDTFYNCFIRLYANDTFTNTELYVKFEKGEKPTGYSTYNNGSIDIKTESKNKFIGWSRNIYTNSSNGNRSSQTNALSSDFCEIEPNTTYRMSGIAVGSYGKNKYISYYDINKNYISRSGSTNVSVITQKTPVNAYYCTLGLNSSFSDAQTMENFINDSANIQLEKGSAGTTYQPYGKDLVTFPFVNGQRLHNGDYLADDGIHQVMGTYKFTGNEDWTKSSSLTTSTSFCCTTSSITPAPKINGTFGYLTIGYAIRYNSTEIAQHNTCFVYNSNSRHFLKIINSAIPNWNDSATDTEKVNLFKAYLSGQYSAGTPVTIEYELAEEIVTPYTTAQQEAYYKLKHLQMYKGYTEIQCIDEIKPSIKANYLYNNDINNTFGSIIDGLEERVHTLENS